MESKNFIIFGVGAASGFVGGSLFVLGKILSSERIREALVDVAVDVIETKIFGRQEHNRSRNVSYRDYYRRR